MLCVIVVRSKKKENILAAKVHGLQQTAVIPAVSAVNNNNSVTQRRGDLEISTTAGSSIPNSGSKGRVLPNTPRSYHSNNVSF